MARWTEKRTQCFTDFLGERVSIGLVDADNSMDEANIISITRDQSGGKRLHLYCTRAK